MRVIFWLQRILRPFWAEQNEQHPFLESAEVLEETARQLRLRQNVLQQERAFAQAQLKQAQLARDEATIGAQTGNLQMLAHQQQVASAQLAEVLRLQAELQKAFRDAENQQVLQAQQSDLERQWQKLQAQIQRTWDKTE